MENKQRTETKKTKKLKTLTLYTPHFEFTYSIYTSFDEVYYYSLQSSSVRGGVRRGVVEAKQLLSAGPEASDYSKNPIHQKQVDTKKNPRTGRTRVFLENEK